ncbi:hypothetical protein [Aneurinibacillus sp. REN35]|uniref:hypothetical protein n=1 Tax=Aneurinibacillus sp. REN35 TaxID=3237286 RepID=UPI003529A499
MEEVQQLFTVLLKNWERMQKSQGEEEAEEDANRFEESFYTFIDSFKRWLNTQKPRPTDVDEVLAIPEVEKMVERLPVPLYLNFETEVEYILEGRERIEEDKYD